MSKVNRYSPEVRERAMRRVLEHEGDYSSRWQAICSVAAKIGGLLDSLKEELRRLEVGQGQRVGTTTSELERLQARKQGNKERRRTNGILNTEPATLDQGRSLC